MNGAQVTMAMVVAAAAGMAWTQEALFRAEESAGACGVGFLTKPAISDTVCAIKCAQSECRGDKRGMGVLIPRQPSLLYSPGSVGES